MLNTEIGVIISAVLNAPGSWHDSHVAQPIFEQLHSHVPDGYYLVADTAFPVTITVRTPALCLLDTSDKSFSLCLPYSSLTLCLIHMDNLTSLLIPFLVRYLCSTYDSFLITNTVVFLVH